MEAGQVKKIMTVELLPFVFNINFDEIKKILVS